MAEYIFEIDDALYNENTGETVVMAKLKGKLVLCRECIHAEDEGTFLWCPVLGTTRMEADDFCSYAERRQDGTACNNH